MRVFFDPEATVAVQIDQMKLATFLQRCGVPQTKIDALEIHIMHKYHKPSGDFQPEQLYGLHMQEKIYLFTHRDATAGRLNRTLLHELRHFMRGGYQPGEAKLAHKDRPSEKDASAFAAEHASTLMLLSIPAASVVASQSSSFEDQLITFLAFEIIIVGVLSLKLLSRVLLRPLFCH